MASFCRGRRSSCWHDFARILHRRHRIKPKGFSLPNEVGLFAPWGSWAGAVQDKHPSAPACEAPQLGWTLGQALLPVPGAGLHPARWRRINRPQVDCKVASSGWRSPPLRPADHALVTRFAPCAERGRPGGLPHLSLPSSASSCEVSVSILHPAVSWRPTHNCASAGQIFEFASN